MRAQVIFDTGALWQAPKTRVWGGQGFSSVAALRLGVPAADDRANFQILAAWSRVAFDAYFATDAQGRPPAAAGSAGVEPYAVADIPTRERFQRSVVAALGGPGAGGSGEAYLREDTISGRLQQPAVVYWRGDGSGRHSVVVALPGSTSVGDWAISFSDEDRDAGTGRVRARGRPLRRRPRRPCPTFSSPHRRPPLGAESACRPAGPPHRTSP